MGLMSVAVGCSARGNHFSGDVLYASSRRLEPRSTVAAGALRHPAWSYTRSGIHDKLLDGADWMDSTLLILSREFRIRNLPISCYFNSLLQAGRSVPTSSIARKKINRLQRRSVSDCASNDDGVEGSREERDCALIGLTSKNKKTVHCRYTP